MNGKTNPLSWFIIQSLFVFVLIQDGILQSSKRHISINFMHKNTYVNSFSTDFSALSIFLQNMIYDKYSQSVYLLNKFMFP